jgi:hypothetical protein
MVSRTAFLIAHATTSSGFRRNESNAEPQTDQQRPSADGCGIEANNIGGGRSQKACWIYSSFLLHADKAANSSASIPRRQTQSRPRPSRTRSSKLR